MAYYAADERPSYPTLTDALQTYTVDYLKKLAVLASDALSATAPWSFATVSIRANARGLTRTRNRSG